MRKALVKLSLYLGACLGAGSAFAQAPPRWSMGLETGAVWQARNDVQVPGDSGTRFALDDVTGDGPFPFLRLEATYRLSEKQELRGLLAPLSISEDGTLSEAVNFNGQTFAAGSATATYQFNSYRLTWRYTLVDSPLWTWKLGVTAKVRDAKIELSQGAVQSANTNTGLVPLLNAYGEYRVGARWRAILDFDGLVGPSGRAFDIGLKCSYDLAKSWSLEGGYRLLEGGADNDTVYSFAWFNYAVLGARYRF